VGLPTELNKDPGLPYGKTAQVLKKGCGLGMTRGGLCHAIGRAGRKDEDPLARG